MASKSKQTVVSQRERFAGGALNSGANDRKLAQWIDEHPGEAWTIMKFIMAQHLDGKLVAANAVGQFVPTTDEGYLGEAANALANFDD